MVVDLHLQTATDGVGVATETQVALEVVAESVVCVLVTSADGQAVNDVVLHTRCDFVGVVAQGLLLVARHACVFVEEGVVASHYAPFRGDAVLCTNGEDGGNIVGRVHAISETGHACCVHFGLVLNVH